jgi:hypothetical protein
MTEREKERERERERGRKKDGVYFWTTRYGNTTKLKIERATICE